MDDAEARARFEDAFARWQRGWSEAASLSEIDAAPARAEILALGPRAVPLLLDELARKPSLGPLTLLVELTGEDPAYGEETVKGAARKWLAWGGRP